MTMPWQRPHQPEIEALRAALRAWGDEPCKSDTGQYALARAAIAVVETYDRQVVALERVVSTVPLIPTAPDGYGVAHDGTVLNRPAGQARGTLDP